MKLGFLFLGLMIFLTPVLASAITINEIMYNLEGTDSGREWVEIFNDSNQEIILSGGSKGSWRFNDGSNHLLVEPPAQGSMTIPVGDYAIFAASTTIFLIDHPNFQGTVIGTAMSLGQQDDRTYKLQIINADIIVDEALYTTSLKANGDGNSLQLVNGNWIAAIPTPGILNAGVSEPPPEQPQEPQSQPSGGGSSYIPPEKLPHIKAYAGEDKTVTVGASAEFRGQGFGLKDEPLDNTRYLWTFGDGSSKEGKNITHVYQYPGDYITVLNVSSGEYSASDYVLVKAIPNQVFISEIKTGADSFIELENKSKEEIDISGCQIKYNSQIFIFTQSTRIRSGAFLVIPSSVSGINLLQGKGLVEFLYSGGFKADSFSYSGFLQDGQSFNRGNVGSLIGQETPGAKNSVIIAQSQSAEVAPPQNRAGGGATSAITPASETTEIKEDNAQTANIITIGDSTGAKSNTKIYLFAVLGLIVFAGGTVLFIRRKSGV